jgi:uncharacterized protein (DUF697 family)
MPVHTFNYLLKEVRTIVSEKQDRSRETIKRYMWWSAGAGLVPVPLVDLAAVSGAQMMMLREISKIYDIPFAKSRGKAAIGSLAGFILPHAASFGAAGCFLKAIPLVGSLAGAPAMAVFSAAYAWALGNVFVQHFESGGTFLDFDADQVRESFRVQFEEGRGKATGKRPDKVEA